MALSKRENLIAVGACAAVALLGLDHFVWTPYVDQRSAVVTQRAVATQQMTDAVTLFQRQRNLRKVWSELQMGGLKVDTSQAASQEQHALNAWAEGAGVSLAALKAERPAQEGPFQVIGFDVTGTGSMRAISRLIWSLETATIPVRINEVQISPRREGTDDLSVRLSVSALCMPPGNDKGDSAAASTFESQGGRS